MRDRYKKKPIREGMDLVYTYKRHILKALKVQKNLSIKNLSNSQQLTNITNLQYLHHPFSTSDQAQLLLILKPLHRLQAILNLKSFRHLGILNLSIVRMITSLTKPNQLIITFQLDRHQNSQLTRAYSNNKEKRKGFHTNNHLIIKQYRILLSFITTKLPSII